MKAFVYCDLISRLWNKFNSTLGRCIKLQHTRSLQKKWLCICTLLLSGRLTYIQCNEILLERAAWQHGDYQWMKMSWNTAVLMLQAEIDLVSVDHLALCNLVCVCVSCRGFLFFSKEIEQYAIPFMGSDPSVVRRTQRLLHEEEQQSPVR